MSTKLPSLIVWIALFGGAVILPASAPAADPQAPQAARLNADQLDKLLGPIALYPDPLLAQILPASTHPHDLVMASAYLKGKKDPAKVDQQPWDLSVKALIHYPDVIKMMVDKLDWTTELGTAFTAQPEDVFASVQHLRSQAAAVGNLKDSPQQVIVHEKETIKIIPANPQVIYVPTYPVTTVYTTPPANPAVSVLAFGAGLAVGAWLANDYDDHWHGYGGNYHGGNYHGGNTVNINNNNSVNIGNGSGNGNGNNIGNGNGNRPGAGNGSTGTGNGNAGAGRPGYGNGGAGAAQQRPATQPKSSSYAQQRQSRDAGGPSSAFTRESSKPQQQGGGGGRFGGGAGGNGGRFGGASSGGGRLGGGAGGGAQRSAGGGGAAQRDGGGGRGGR